MKILLSLMIICMIGLVSAVTLNVGTVLNTTGNITINIQNFSITADQIDLNNDSITFYNLTYLHPNACNNTFKPVFNYTQSNVNSSTMDWTVTCSKNFYLSFCNSTNNVPFINFTFKDQVNTSINLNGSILTSTFNTYPNGFPSLVKTYIYSNAVENSTFQFCINQPDYIYWVNYSINYGGTGYASSSKVSNGTILLTNISTDDFLYLYNSSIPKLITFQVINSFNQPVEGAYAYITDYYDINNTIIASGYTDSGGIIDFYMSNATSYKVYFSKSGYDTYSTILIPVDISGVDYTITLSGLGISVTTPPDYTGGSSSTPNSKGVTYSTKPSSTYLENDTYYLFNYTIDSGVWTLSNWGFNLTDQNNNLINSTSSTSTSGGTLSLNQSTSNYTKVIMNFYYTINGNTTNLQRVWMIIDTSDSSYSISHAVDDVKSYIGSGLFGITPRGLSFVVLFIIFIGAGVLSYKFGITSPTAILGFVFTAVYFFDVNLGWIPNPLQAVPHLATILVGIVLLGFIVKEVSQ